MATEQYNHYIPGGLCIRIPTHETVQNVYDRRTKRNLKRQQKRALLEFEQLWRNWDITEPLILPLDRFGFLELPLAVSGYNVYHHPDNVVNPVKKLCIKFPQ